MKKIIGLVIAIILWNLLSLALLGINIPIPSSYIALIITANTIFAFFSIFLQRLVITLYESNVFGEPKSIADYLFKYIAILTSGMNYYIQIIFRRLPFILNKLAALLFFIFHILMWSMLGFIFNN
ncbi:hypothetical protein [Terribacillus halophilus]|jgi:hypothetical protein|uniref:hypothetical protein n=1 Tax=Terribacillus halophilus TaxID=361279 RepID=UPI000984DE44|nr:hypothetical protein [Terribacillus halophilus]